MERKVSYNDVKKTVENAFEQFKSLHDGIVDSRLTQAKGGGFGISIALIDGRTINVGDTQTLFPIGSLAKIPMSVVLLSQNTPQELTKKSGRGCCKCKDRSSRPEVPFSPHGVRAVSAIVPQGDADGKYEIIVNKLIDMAGSEPVLDDQLFKAFCQEADNSNSVKAFTESGYELYDDPAISIEVFNKLRALQLCSEQLAAVGATIAADGCCPVTGEYAFDGSIASTVVAMLSARGMKHKMKSWIIETGLPAKGGFGGGIVAVLPGFGAIATYSPELNECGLSLKGAKAIEYIARELELNVFASARVVVE